MKVLSSERCWHQQRPLQRRGPWLLLCLLAVENLRCEAHTAESGGYADEQGFLSGPKMAKLGQPAIVLVEQRTEAAHSSKEKNQEEEAVSEYEKNLGEEEVHVTPVTFTIACLLMMFLVVNMVLLYLVNYRDANIRSYVCKMLNSTVSIFLAVVFNQAVFSFWLEQIFPAPWPRGFGVQVTEKTWLGVGLFLFVIFFTLTTILGYVFRNNVDRAFAVQVMSGHVTAFAGIITFGSIQQILKKPFIVLIVAVGTLMLLRLVSSQLRVRFIEKTKEAALVAGYREVATAETEELELPAESREVWKVNLHNEMVPYTSDVCATISKAKREKKDAVEIDIRGTPYVIDLKEMKQKLKSDPHKTRKIEMHIEEGEDWREGVCEAEDDATSLILSFLTMQGVIFVIDGKIQPLHGEIEKHSQDEILKGLEACLAWLVVLIIATLLRGVMIRLIRTLSPAAKQISWNMRMLASFQTYLAQTMSWCLVSTGMWEMLQFFESQELAQVFNAVAMSALAIFLVVVLDKLADKMASEKPMRSLTNLSLDELANESKEEQQLDFALSEMKAHFDAVSQNMLSTQNHEKAVRNVIHGLSLLVGIVWEKAFDAAEEALLLYSEATRHHLVVTKLGMVALLMAVVGPAWIMYIVPAARMSSEEHAGVMRAQMIEQVKVLMTKGDIKQADRLIKTFSDGQGNGDGGNALQQAVKEDAELMSRVAARFKLFDKL
eukprot:TRINITY_DN3697_c0_g1_i2.p1 TRINITY_DN3697_c0_g1~~TRINITY_DN3697_c0_g1_i2.p1  ORF type:complete len:717 (-),score=165.47 TRINITY_DN3697_c0_g1_i2:220-2370(-)